MSSSVVRISSSFSSSLSVQSPTSGFWITFEVSVCVCVCMFLHLVVNPLPLPHTQQPLLPSPPAMFWHHGRHRLQPLLLLPLPPIDTQTSSFAACCCLSVVVHIYSHHAPTTFINCLAFVLEYSMHYLTKAIRKLKKKI